MNVTGRLKRAMSSLLVLCLCCLVLEQVVHSVLVPGYFFRMLMSPVFWGLVSGACFLKLFTMTKDTDFQHNSEDAVDEIYYGINYASGLPMVNSMVDVMGFFNGENEDDD